VLTKTSIEKSELRNLMSSNGSATTNQGFDSGEICGGNSLIDIVERLKLGTGTGDQPRKTFTRPTGDHSIAHELKSHRITSLVSRFFL
jgi:hypothetical protein